MSTSTARRLRSARLVEAIAATALLLAACSDSTAPEAEDTPVDSTPTASATASPTAPATTEATSETPNDTPNEGLTPDEREVAARLTRYFPEMDWTMKSIDLTTLRDGGPGRDGGIPSLQDPSFELQDQIDWLEPTEPVIALEVNGEARAYPIQVLMWHEIATDTLGGVPVTVSFCPLCNTAIVFDRRVDGAERQFGVSGLLRESDLIMYDYTNASLWQQITGEAIVGVDVGTRLTFLPSQIISWAQFQQSYPDALVLSRNTGFQRNYGSNPYPGYDRVGSSTIFPTSFDDERLDAKERVLTVERGGETLAFPFAALAEHGVLAAEVEGDHLVALWAAGTNSPLDATRITSGADIGSAGVFLAQLEDRPLTFEVRDGQIVDRETGSVWNVLGHAIEGPSAGARLEPLVAANHLWFAWSIFKPETRIIRE